MGRGVVNYMLYGGSLVDVVNCDGGCSGCNENEEKGESGEGGEVEGENLHARWEAGHDCTAAHDRHRIIPTTVHYWPNIIASTKFQYQYQSIYRVKIFINQLNSQLTQYDEKYQQNTINISHNLHYKL